MTCKHGIGIDDLCHECNALVKCKSCGIPLVDHLGLHGTCAELQRAKTRIEELESLIDLQHKRTLVADQLWQRETGKACFPDLGTLIEWLIEKAELNDASKPYVTPDIKNIGVH